MVLGGRHLVGIFALLVVVLGVVFTLGYLLGRSQYDTQLQGAVDAAPLRPEKRPVAAQKASTPESRARDDSSAAPPPTDWDFYHSGQPDKQPDRLTPEPQTVAKSQPAAAPAPAPVPARSGAAKIDSANGGASKPDAATGAPLIPRGATVLQVAALVRENDALALAQALQQKKFPAFVLTPGADHFYRVQVGPYADAQSASIARHQLEGQGFKTIIKR